MGTRQMTDLIFTLEKNAIKIPYVSGKQFTQLPVLCGIERKC